MENSIIGRIQLPRATPVSLSVRDGGTRLRRTLRTRTDTPTPLHEVFVAVWRRKWLLLATMAIGGVAAGLAGLARPPLYEATTQVIIDAPSGGAPGTDVSQQIIDASIDDHLTRLSSQAQLRRVLAALVKLDDSSQGASGQAVGETSSPANTATTSASETRSATSALLHRLWPYSGTDSPEAIEAAELKYLSQRMRVGQELQSRVISIGYTDTDPARAATVSNLIARVYIENLQQSHRIADQQELNEIHDTLPKVRDQLVAATDRLEAYRLTHGAADQGTDNASREIADLSRQVSISTANLAEAEAKLKRVQQLRTQQPPSAELAEAMGSVVLGQLIARRSEEGANADLTKQIDQEIDRGLNRLESDVNIYRAQVAALTERRSGLDAAAADAATQLSELRALEPAVSIATQQYNNLLARQQELTRRIAAPDAGISVLSTAWPPANPKTLSAIFLVVPGMIVAGLLCAIYLIVRHRFDSTLRGEIETEEALGIPCAGLLPKLPKMGAKKLQTLLLEQPSAIYSRAVGSLLFNAMQSQAKATLPAVMLVTSSSSTDGKTALAWSLALSATRLGGRVLFINFDKEDVRLTREFREEFSSSVRRQAFRDYASGQATLHEAVEDMREIGVDFMSGSALSGDLLPLLSSIDGSQVFDELRATYNVVIIDAPSGLESPAARLIASWADVIFFAVRWGKTKRNIARGVLDLLGIDPNGITPAVGAVLTQVDPKKHATYRFGDSGDLLLVQG